MSTFTIAPVAGALGAEIHGLDLATPLSPQQRDQLNDAFNQHSVLFFRDQNLEPEQQIAFARNFGELGSHPYVAGTDAHPEMLEIVTEPDDEVNFGGGWHCDVTFLEQPDLGSVLYAVDVPPVGGDTLWASQQAAWDALSPTMQEFLLPLTAIHSPSRQYGAQGQSTMSKAMATKGVEKAMEASVEHPVVRTHPVTGRKGLYVNAAFTMRIRGLRKRESDALLRFLFDHATNEAFTCRFKWEPGSLAMWDNRSVQHFALHDYKGHRRVMRRVTIQGDKPA